MKNLTFGQSYEIGDKLPDFCCFIIVPHSMKKFNLFADVLCLFHKNFCQFYIYCTVFLGLFSRANMNTRANVAFICKLFKKSLAKFR